MFGTPSSAGRAAAYSVLSEHRFKICVPDVHVHGPATFIASQPSSPCASQDLYRSSRNGTRPYGPSDSGRTCVLPVGTDRPARRRPAAATAAAAVTLPTVPQPDCASCRRIPVILAPRPVTGRPPRARPAHRGAAAAGRRRAGRSGKNTPAGATVTRTGPFAENRLTQTNTAKNWVLNCFD
jgi:hypothetical protein